MLESLVRGALKQRLVVCVIAVMLLFFGLNAATKLSVDAFPDVTNVQVQIATAEVAANIVEHTGSGHPLRIRMSAAVTDDQVHVSFTDNGPPADIDLTQVTMPTDMAERGRGLAMAQALLDRLAYRCDETGNHWTLVSKRIT